MDLLSAFTSKALVFPGLLLHYLTLSSPDILSQASKEIPKGNALCIFCHSCTRVCIPLQQGDLHLWTYRFIFLFFFFPTSLSWMLLMSRKAHKAPEPKAAVHLSEHSSNKVQYFGFPILYKIIWHCAYWVCEVRPSMLLCYYVDLRSQFKVF